MEEKAYIVDIRGLVTGVGFRYSAFDRAAGLGLKGYVRNAGRGHVEAFVQGPGTEVETMLAWLRRGPRFARVDSFEAREAAPKEDAGPFDII